MALFCICSDAILSAMDTTAITKACEIVGGQSAMADALCLSVSAINQWCAGRRPVPALHCPTIERLTDGKVICEQLCSDVDWAYLRKTKRKAA